MFLSSKEILLFLILLELVGSVGVGGGGGGLLIFFFFLLFFFSGRT